MAIVSLITTRKSKHSRSTVHFVIVRPTKPNPVACMTVGVISPYFMAVADFMGHMGVVGMH